MVVVAGIVLVLGTLVITAGSQKPRNYCYAKDDNPYLSFGSKTAYDFVNSKARIDDVPYCEPIQMWMLARHGTRFPRKDEIIEMKELKEIQRQIVSNHANMRDGSMCEQDLRNLMSWNLEKWDLDGEEAQARAIVDQGHAELVLLARRYKKKFPALLSRPNTSGRYQFRFTDAPRSTSSANDFACGIFGGPVGSKILPYKSEKDGVLEGNKNCPVWVKKVVYDPNVLVEQRLFIQGTAIQNLPTRVSGRLGVNVTLKEVELMHNMCRHEKAWKINEKSPWCALFTREDLKLLEYKEDLQSYYQSGYGHELNGKLGCTAVRDIFNRFSRLESNAADELLGVFFFTHSTGILQALTSLGIAKDITHLMHDNYEMMRYRKWQTSKIGPFASNLVAVFHKCSRGDPHRVMFLLQEEVVQYEGCDQGLCSWEVIKKKLAIPASECNLEWCTEDIHSGKQGAILKGLLLLGGLVVMMAVLKMVAVQKLKYFLHILYFNTFHVMYIYILYVYHYFQRKRGYGPKTYNIYAMISRNNSKTY